MAMLSVTSPPTPLRAARVPFNTKNSSPSFPSSASSGRIRVGSTSAFATSAAASSNGACTADAQPRTSSSYCLSFHGMSSYTSFYDVLGIPDAATSQEIKVAYRRLARLCHPDVAAIDRKDSSADDFMKIHAAYSTLSDPEKRADYDRTLFRRYQPSTVKAARFSCYTCRNWETDQCW